MARGRIIDREIFSHEVLGENSITCRYFYHGLIVLADDEGRLKGNAKYLKARIFPYDDISEKDIQAMVDKLASIGCLLVYQVRQDVFLAHPKWSKWQPMRKDRIKPSDCPSPDDGIPTVNQLSTKCPPNPTQPNPTEPNRTQPKAVAVATSPQAEFVLNFGKTYEAMTKQPFKAGREDYVIVARLLKDYGYDAVVLKARTLGILCDDRLTWFTKGGWADYTLKTLSAHWNSILADVKLTPDQEFQEEMRKVKEQNERVNRSLNG